MSKKGYLWLFDENFIKEGYHQLTSNAYFPGKTITAVINTR